MIDLNGIYNRSGLSGPRHIEQALTALGELLSVEGIDYKIVIIGGSALNLLGFVDRVTMDVDILAFGRTGSEHSPISIVEPPEPLPQPLQKAILMIARELRLTPDWLNTGPALQWKQGLPPGLERRIQWREFNNLTVGLVDRYDLIFFKLYAAADAGRPESIHYQDLVALKPTRQELFAAAKWIKEQDPSPDFAGIVDRLLVYLDKNLA